MDTLIAFFKGEFAIPGDDNPFRIKYTSAQNIPHGILEEQPAMPPPGTVETVVYDSMTAAGFAEFQDRFLAKWFKPVERPRTD